MFVPDYITDIFLSTPLPSHLEIFPQSCFFMVSSFNLSIIVAPYICVCIYIYMYILILEMTHNHLKEVYSSVVAT